MLIEDNCSNVIVCVSRCVKTNSEMEKDSQLEKKLKTGEANEKGGAVSLEKNQPGSSDNANNGGGGGTEVVVSNYNYFSQQAMVSNFVVTICMH